VTLPLLNNEAMFDCLKKEGVKIGVLSTATVICHYVHECLGNILEASGVQVNPGKKIGSVIDLKVSNLDMVSKNELQTDRPLSIVHRGVVEIYRRE
jgi:hypothetical protein